MARAKEEVLLGSMFACARQPGEGAKTCFQIIERYEEKTQFSKQATKNNSLKCYAGGFFTLLPFPRGFVHAGGAVEVVEKSNSLF